jgi:dihydrofolate reductase
MRKIINSAFVSLDGVTADAGSWAIFGPDAAGEAGQALHALGGMLMGRGTYEYFADVMPKQTGPYADAINAIRKYVLSSTLENADWNNSTLIRDDAVTAVTELKQEDGGDLMMYGYGRLSQTLLAHHLVDETRFPIHPVLAGRGAAGGGNGKTLPLIAPRRNPSAERCRRAHLPACLQLSGKARRGHKPAGPQPHPRTGTTAATMAASLALPTRLSAAR